MSQNKASGFIQRHVLRNLSILCQISVCDVDLSYIRMLYIKSKIALDKKNKEDDDMIKEVIKNMELSMQLTNTV